MAKTPDDKKSREAEARRAGIRIVARDGVRLDGPTPTDGPGESTPAEPAAARGSERRDRNPRRDAVKEALSRYKKHGRPDRPPTPTTDEELRRRQREHLGRVHAGRNGGKTRDIDCLHNRCTSCWGTRVKANGEPCIHMIACGCARCNPVRPTLMASNGTSWIGP